MPKAKHRDLYMNWFPMSVATGADSSVLVEGKHATGMSIRGGLAWLVHKVEFQFALHPNATAAFYLALCTVAGLGALPSVASKGLICLARQVYLFTTSGAVESIRPWKWDCLPPTPVASANLSLYAAGSNNPNLVNTTYYARMGFTTVELDVGMYTEIAETWGY